MRLPTAASESRQIKTFSAQRLQREGGRRPHSAAGWRLRQRFTVGRGERLDERVRQMFRRHLDEVAIEAREQVPVLRLVGGAGLATACGALEARLQLRRVEPAEEFHERRARRLRGGRLVQLGLERSEEHTSELQSQSNLVCRLLLEKKKKKNDR